MPNHHEKFVQLRKKYPTFTYESFKVTASKEELLLEFQFVVNENIHFEPRLSIPHRSFYQFDTLSEEQVNLLAFHIGMIELVSYWKATCSPTVVIKPFALSEAQIEWWKKLYFKGLGEFLYVNEIRTTQSELMTIESVSDTVLKKQNFKLYDEFIVPVGGGKDSVVTLELLRLAQRLTQRYFRPMIINPRGASLNCARVAGFEREQIIEVNRTIHPRLLELNAEGFLNGHTPFSAMLAFVSLLTSAITRMKHIALSNESSANESTVLGQEVNHQYSKSLEFENDFNDYVKEYLSEDFNYFSFLRPFSELMIAQHFSEYTEYHSVFRSCNAGSKEDIWCCNCAKCLFAYIILSPFIEPQKMREIFGEDLLDKLTLKHEFNQLLGLEATKPFECVGTVSEVKEALNLHIKYYPDHTPALIQYYKTLALFDPDSDVTFDLWAPTAEEVVLRIYDSGIEGNCLGKISMKPTADGCWRASLMGDYEGKFYTFEIRIGETWYGETPGILAKAVGVNGLRGAIINLEETNPTDWEHDKRPVLSSFSEIVIGEVHHREFSISPNSGIQNKGKFLSWTERGTTNGDGLSTGIDHLVDLGITHVHFLPSFDFATIDETKLDVPQFNWGYDPLNYNVPEGSYSTDPYDPYARISEFKQMVQSLHQSGIRVIMDVVFNHVFSIPDSPFERTVPGYFFRKKADGTYANGSGCFSEMASERPMVRQFIVDSLVYWATEYHIDGFRFDLMGIHDIETMNAVREALNKVDPSIFVYGEGWSAEPPQLPFEALAMKANTMKLNGVAAFSDEFRDGLRGNWFNNKVGGFAVGVPNSEESVKFGLVGGIEHPQIDYGKINYDPKRAWAEQPTQFISYVSCHDDMCLVDKLKFTTPPNTDEKQLLKHHKLAQTAVLLSQGVPFMLMGEEIFRDKKGVHNTYKSPDSINLINWANKTRYLPLFNYYKGLIALRKAHPAFRMGNADLIRKHLNFLPVPQGNVIAFELTNHANGDAWGHIIVVLNGNLDDVTVDIPQGTYTEVLRDGMVNAEGLGRFTGASVKVSGSSALVIWK